MFQSLLPVYFNDPTLKNWIDSDAVFINGQSGDFISGGHISSFSTQNFQRSDLERKHKVNLLMLKNTIVFGSF